MPSQILSFLMSLMEMMVATERASSGWYDITAEGCDWLYDIVSKFIMEVLENLSCS